MFHGSIPKDYSRPHENEDVFNIDFTEHIIRVALSDGATVSYDSKNWAKTLTDCFIKMGMLSAIEIKQAIKTYYSDRFDFRNMTIIQRRGLMYGSFATFLGVEYNCISDRMHILGIGDSIVVLLDREDFAGAFPYVSSAQFNDTPPMLSTKNQSNFFFLHANDMSKFYKIWGLRNIKNPVILCMTDALGKWALKEMESGNRGVWRELLSINNLKEFKQFVQGRRDNHTIRIDDTTLISIKLETKI